jgi:prefoldin alpha subunit
MMVGKRSMKVLDLRNAKLTPKGKSILVPLTSSLYVPGTLKYAGKVLVDIGTGYYVEKVQVDCNDLLTK